MTCNQRWFAKKTLFDVTNSETAKCSDQRFSAFFESCCEMLMINQAIEIYKHKIANQKIARPNRESNRSIVASMRRETKKLAKTYEVTVRAIQDIWKRLSWAFATSHLWVQEPDDSKSSKPLQMSAAEVSISFYAFDQYEPA